MPGYVARRLLSAIPVLFLVTLISFGIMQIVPGDPAMIIAGLGASPQEVARIRTQLGLDQPPLVQLARWYDVFPWREWRLGTQSYASELVAREFQSLAAETGAATRGQASASTRRSKSSAEHAAPNT